MFIEQTLLGFLSTLPFPFVEHNQLTILMVVKNIFPGKDFNVVFMVLIGIALFVVGSLLGWFSRRIWTHKKPLSNPFGTFEKLFHIASSYLHVNK